MGKPKLLSPWRRFFQWLCTLSLLVIPWIQPGGQSLLRIDLSNLSLLFFGQTLRIGELYLFLFFCLAFGLGFLLTTLVFGRVWCGWACPQTTLSDLGEWLAVKFRLKIENYQVHGAAWKKALLHSSYALLAFLVSANLLWYFIEPQRFFSELFSGQLHYAAGFTLVITGLLIYLDLAFIRRIMCRDFCPYGRFQTGLVDPATLCLHLPESEKSRCIECGACVRSCPMEIDIRQGYQVECINCGRCLDACRKVMVKRDQEGLIRYTFGLENKGPGALFNPRTMLLSVAILALSAILIAAVIQRPSATLKVSISHTAGSRLLKDGQLGTFFNAWVNNRGNTLSEYRLTARDAEDQSDLALKGQTEHIQLEPGENRRLDFILLTKPPARPTMVEIVLLDVNGIAIAVTRAQILPFTEEK